MPERFGGIPERVGVMPEKVGGLKDWEHVRIGWEGDKLRVIPNQKPRRLFSGGGAFDVQRLDRAGMKIGKTTFDANYDQA
jgi:hypothetical protein